jgi:hypothetical protein
VPAGIRDAFSAVLLHSLSDPAIERLPGEVRAAIAAHWRRRTKSELQVGRAVAAMVPLLRDSGAPRVVVEMLARSSEEEERHASLCADLAHAYGGAPFAVPDVREVALPRFDVGDDALELALLVSGMCCVNETIATAWIGAALEAATAPIAIEANRAHVRDEIDHARLGWAYVASTSRDTRDALASCLPRLLAANIPGWERGAAGLPEEGIPAHGHLDAASLRGVVHAAVRDLVIPGFAHVGVDTTSAVAWLQSTRSAPECPTRGV